MSAARVEQDWQLPPTHPVFAGHFPGRPLVPGVMILDAVAAAAGVRVDAVDSVKFLSPLAPGETCRLLAERDGARLRFTVHSGTRRIAEGQMTVS